MRVFLFLETALLFPLVFAENGKTAELLHRVNQDVISVLIDCIYSRAKLDNLFDIKTEYRDFYIDKSTTVKMPFLRTTGIYNVAFTDEAAVVSIPYKSDAKVLFILPEEEKLSEIENNLSKETIQKWTKSMDMRYMDLSLPKFSVSATINIKDVSLKVLADLFPDISDISGITGEANVKVSRIQVISVTIVSFSVIKRGVPTILTTQKGAKSSNRQKVYLGAVPPRQPPNLNIEDKKMEAAHQFKRERTHCTGLHSAWKSDISPLVKLEGSEPGDAVRSQNRGVMDASVYLWKDLGWKGVVLTQGKMNYGPVVTLGMNVLNEFGSLLLRDPSNETLKRWDPHTPQRRNFQVAQVQESNCEGGVFGKVIVPASIKIVLQPGQTVLSLPVRACVPLEGLRSLDSEGPPGR
ncbi:unnamed protein product [Ranitomeya imitator]|uniref:Thyroxine-binding globulin n=1 Tax=Ranitomeya imitator TaxID=111125 RepID=A0ABN9LSE0_9NEOB|nr:unnamed protein product [Ranitomeya imitator]